MRALSEYVFMAVVPFVMLGVASGTLVPPRVRRAVLFWMAEWTDRSAKTIHERIAYELDTLTEVNA